jgi:hypothetical protein
LGSFCIIAICDRIAFIRIFMERSIFPQMGGTQAIQGAISRVGPERLRSVPAEKPQLADCVRSPRDEQVVIAFDRRRKKRRQPNDKCSGSATSGIVQAHTPFAYQCCVGIRSLTARLNQADA